MPFLKRVLPLFAMALFAVPLAFAQVIDKPAATVNLVKPEYISVNQLDQRVNQVEAIRRQNGLPVPADAKMQVLDSMIAEILINQAAERANLSVTQTEVDDLVSKQKASAEVQLGPVTDQQFHNIVEQQTGLSWNAYLAQIKQQILQQKYIMKEKQNVLDSVATPTEQQIQDQYGQIASRLTNPEIVRFSQVFIDTRNLNAQEKLKAKQRADEAYQKYTSGQATFNQIVEQYTDDAHSRYTGGDFGYLARDDARAIQVLGQDFVNQVFSLKVGQVSGVLQSNIGYHIVKLTEHYPPKLLTLDDQISPTDKTTVREYIRNSIIQQEKAQAFQQAVNDIVVTLKKQADITIYKQNIN
ncbi:MAG TPA: peptidylprolyl isomerase [Spirochaetia bacterium]|nr:peptidylprolyl isomerase [Spirochaetia bacterium]